MIMKWINTLTFETFERFPVLHKLNYLLGGAQIISKAHSLHDFFTKAILDKNIISLQIFIPNYNKKWQWVKAGHNVPFFFRISLIFDKIQYINTQTTYKHILLTHTNIHLELIPIKSYHKWNKNCTIFNRLNQYILQILQNILLMSLGKQTI